jgi:Na+-transporting NADH:ubiquinone oxidoreductase subunit NqrB
VSNFSTELNDPRYFQILYLGSFLFYGISYLGWDLELYNYLSIVIVALATQFAFTYNTSKKFKSLKSALITALGLCLLLKVQSPYIGALAAFIAIASKFLIRHKNKHIFNPANIGIVASIVLTGEAWVSPGQWGSSAIMWFFIGSAGLMMILKVGRLDTTISFLLTFGILLFARQVLYLGWENAVWLHKMSNGTLLLFAFFMITDPMTTPNHKTARIIWAILIGVTLFIVSNFYYIQTAAIWILFLISPLTLLFDRTFSGVKYEWTNNQINKDLPNKKLNFK